MGGRCGAEHGRCGAATPAAGLVECSVDPLSVVRALLGADQVARTQIPPTPVRPRPMRLRRFSAAVRYLSQALFLVVPR